MFGLNKARFIEVMNRIFNFPEDILEHLYRIYDSLYRGRLIRRYNNCIGITLKRQIRDTYDDDDDPWDLPQSFHHKKWAKFGPGF